MGFLFAIGLIAIVAVNGYERAVREAERTARKNAK